MGGSVARRKSRPRPRRGAALIAVWRGARLAAALAFLSPWGPSHAGEPAPEEPSERLGPLEIDPAGRDRVRGGHPEGATIHEAYVPRPVEPEAVARRALAGFESQLLPPTAALHRPPPEPWLRALSLPELPIRWSEATIAYLRYFRDDPQGRALIKGWIRRMGRYERRLREILREVGVPEDLVFVAMAESGFDPRRRSRVGAAGMWQFMAATGGVYGLSRSFWVDERLDIERSTYAAAAYLKDLRARFGSWELALAAYNAGYGLVLTSVSRYNSNNFWALCEIESGLPQATTRYVPKILAAALVGRNRPVFAVDSGSLESLPPIAYAEVMVPARSSLATIAAVIDEEPALIAELNAHYIRGRVPADGEEHPVRVPVAKKERLVRGQGRLHSEAATLETIHVRYGETTRSLAARVGSSEATIRRLNGIEDNAELAREIPLVVPRRGGAVAASAPTKGKRGEEEERPLAAVPAVVVAPGERLVFFAATRATTPRGLSEVFGVPWESIVAWNDLDPQARIQHGQILQVVVGADFQPGAESVVIYGPEEVEHVIRGSTAHLDASLARRGLIRRGYKVRAGDTLKKIGARFGLTDGDLARINGIPRTQAPKRGTTLVVYVPKGKTKGTSRPPEPSPTAVVDAAAALEAGDLETSELHPSELTGGDAEEEEADERPPKVQPSRRTPSTRSPSTPTTSKIPGARPRSP